MNMENDFFKMYEVNLPAYLQEDIDRLVAADPKTCLSYDCLLDEVYGSINSAMVDDEISEDQAWYLREKYLGLTRE